MSVGALRIGTAGWSYADWKGPVYPSSPPRHFDQLTFYAQHFNAVEVNSTFYRVPNARVVAGWAARTPDDFLFAVKLFRDLTHGDAPGDAATFKAFAASIAPLRAAGKLGCVLAQFPPRFRPDAGAFAYLSSLVDRLDDAPTVVEFRHRSWIEDGRLPEVIERLSSHRLGIVGVDEPSVGGNIPAAAIRTSPIGYMRFHGRNARDWWPAVPRARAERLRAEIAERANSAADRRAEERRLDAALERQKSQRYNYLYSRAELEEWSGRIAAINQGALASFVIANNHYLGQAFANAKMLQDILGEPISGPRLPAVDALIREADSVQTGSARADPEWGQLPIDQQG